VRRQVCFIVNPVSGGRSGRVDHPLARQLRELRPDAELLLTARAGEATELARARSMREDLLVIAVGGDGTVHEVAAGLVGGRALMGVIPVGSGNDFAKMLASPKSAEAALAWFEQAQVRACDVGKLRIEQADGLISEGHFINSLGIGFEAVVAASAARARVFKGFSRYLVAALRHLVSYRAPHMLIRYKDQLIDQRQFLVALGNGRCAGGGFMLTPGAKIDDGLLELCRADAMSLPRLLMILPCVFSGRHGRFRGVHMARVERISIDCPEGCMVHADGEIVAERAVGIEVSLHRGGLSLLG
jgi:diacylglycerol kinase (ATP)